MKKNKLTLLITAVLVLGIIAGVSVYAANNYGSKDDPLVAKSYLDQVLTPQLMDKVDEKIDAALAQSGGESGSAETYKVVTLSRGQTLTGKVGCEVMLRVGTASCTAIYNPGLVDTTGGTALNSGSSLVKNHLYMVTIEGGGFTATADTVKVLARGSYTIK